jgi:hypothetical protein
MESPKMLINENPLFFTSHRSAIFKLLLNMTEILVSGVALPGIYLPEIPGFPAIEIRDKKRTHLLLPLHFQELNKFIK